MVFAKPPLDAVIAARLWSSIYIYALLIFLPYSFFQKGSSWVVLESLATDYQISLGRSGLWLGHSSTSIYFVSKHFTTTTRSMSLSCWRWAFSKSAAFCFVFFLNRFCFLGYHVKSWDDGTIHLPINSDRPPLSFFEKHSHSMMVPVLSSWRWCTQGARWNKTDNRSEAKNQFKMRQDCTHFGLF